MVNVNPINSPFDGSQFHHLHINDNHAIGLYIPTKLHCGIYHNWKTGEGLNEINKSALLWLCEQSIINGDRYNPELGDKKYFSRITPQRVSIDNMERVANIGKYGESFDDVLSRLIKYWETGKKEE